MKQLSSLISRPNSVHRTELCRGDCIDIKGKPWKDTRHIKKTLGILFPVNSSSDYCDQDGGVYSVFRLENILVLLRRGCRNIKDKEEASLKFDKNVRAG